MEETNYILNDIDKAKLEEMAECLKTLAHPIRLKLINILMQGEFPVYTLAEFCKKPHNQISAHLRLMKKCGLVGSIKKRTTVFYYIKCNQLPNLMKCMIKKFEE